jgi:hypothetical protein
MMIHATGRRAAPRTISCHLKSNPILWGSRVVGKLYEMDQELEPKGFSTFGRLLAKESAP